eukprot:Gb_18284 [translate_table: standard]
MAATKSVLKYLDKLQKQFLWSGSLESKKWHLISFGEGSLWPNTSVIRIRWDISCLPVEGKGSLIWDCIKLGCNLIKKHLFWIPQDGAHVDFCYDSWIHKSPIITEFPCFLPLKEAFVEKGWSLVVDFQHSQVSSGATNWTWKPKEIWTIEGKEEQKERLWNILQDRHVFQIRNWDLLALDRKG